jgi:hypothetical protein
MRLTIRLLEAVVYMAGGIEADGTDNMQGFTTDAERETMFDACCAAGAWAGRQIRQRERRAAARKDRA